MDTKKNTSENASFAIPVVSVLGHVDHGKTSLLDAIRKTNHAQSEVGGITQRIGASQIQTTHDGTVRTITFIDTPGHQAFSNMRQYGVSAADIALLIVSSDDGVMPQTRESIQLLKDSKLPYVVVFTKIDLEAANIEKVKQQILREGILLEGLGGEVPFIGVSSKTGQGIQELLDLILLVFDLNSSKEKQNNEFVGVVIESQFDKRKGALVTVVVKNGELQVGDKLYQSTEIGKVRALINPLGQAVKIAASGEAVEILGVTSVLPTGSLLYTKPGMVALPSAEASAITNRPPTDLVSFFDTKKSDHIKVLLKTQGHGELVAIKNSLPKNVDIVYEGTGEVGVSDVMLAKDLKAIIIGFNVNMSKEASRLAETEGVLCMMYTLIYELLEQLEDALSALKQSMEEKILGQASILASFGSEPNKVLGVRVASGRLALGDTVKLMRGSKELGRSTIASLKRGKQDVKEVAKGLECGLVLSPGLDFILGDMLLSYK